MGQFARRIFADKDYRNFYFNSISAEEGNLYHVSVVGNDRKTHVFYLRENAGKWNLLSLKICPPWVVEIEKRLEEEILNFLKEGDLPGK